MSMSDKNKSIAAIIVDKVQPKEKIVGDLEADFEDAKNAAFEEFMEAIEKKDVAQLKSAFLAILEMCSEESQYEIPEEAKRV